MKLITRIAPDVGWLPISFVNVFFVGQPGGRWVLFDAGLPGRHEMIVEAAEARFGAGAKPQAILLTHGHGDHSGSARELAEHWDVPVYADPLEFPYLDGRSKYPPADPTIGGAMAFLTRFMPLRPPNLSSKLRALPSNGEVPGLPDWKWLATPGHSPGHVVYYRPADGVVIAGDAVATMDMDSWSGLLTAKKTLARSGSPFTLDWEQARASVQEIAKLSPKVLAAGHGLPRDDEDLPKRFARFANYRFRAPAHGRYVRTPARADENGIVSLPPAPLDPVPFATAAALIVAGIALGAGYLDDDTH